MAKRDAQRRIDVAHTAAKAGSSYVLPPSGGGSGGGSGMVVHNLVGEWHKGSLTDFPEYVAHLANRDAHHWAATGGDGIAVTSEQVVSIKLDELANHPGLEFTNTKLHVGLGAGLYVEGANIGLGRPGAVSAASQNAVATGTRSVYSENGHTHQVLAYSDGITNPGQLLKTDAQGAASIATLTTNKVTAPNDLALEAANVITVPQRKYLRSTDADRAYQFNSSFPIKGFQIGPVDGSPGKSNLTIGSIQADELFVRIFVANETRVDRGEFYISKSYGFLSEPFTTPDIDAYTRIYFDDSPAMPARIFSDNDWIMFQVYDASGGGLAVTKVWGQVSLYQDEDPGKKNQQSFRFTMREGPEGYELKKGAFAVGWGASGQAIIKMSAVDEAGNPYIKLSRWQTVVDDGVTKGPNAPAAHTDLVHIGKLSASQAAHQGEYGIVLADGGTQSVEVSDAGVYLTNANIVMSSGDYRTVEILPSGNLKLGTNVQAATTTGFSFDAATGNVTIGQSSGQKVLWNGATKKLSISGELNVLPGSDGFGNFTDGNMDNIDDGADYGRIKMTIIRDGEIQVSYGASYNVKDTNLRGWNIGVGEIVGQYDGVDQVVLDTSGIVNAGAGSVQLSVTGLDLKGYQLVDTTLAPAAQQERAISWWDNFANKTVPPLARIYSARSTTGTGSFSSLTFEVEPDAKGTPSIVLQARTSNITQLWFNYIDQFVGIPGIFPTRNPDTNAATVQFSGTLQFKNHLLRYGSEVVDIGTSGAPFHALYVDNIVAGTITGGTQISGAIWQNDAADMYVQSNSSSTRTLHVSNPGTGTMHLDVEGNITVGGTVDSVDILSFKGLYDTHVADTNIHHNKSHAYDSTDHTGSLSWSKIDKTGSSLAHLAARAHSSLTGIGADDHHAQAHAYDSADHTGSLSWSKINKTGSDLAHLATRAHSSLTGIGADDHHAQVHSIVGSDHTLPAGTAQYRVVGATAADTLGLLTPSIYPAQTAALLRTDTDGSLGLYTLYIGGPSSPSITLDAYGGNIANAPDISFSGNASIASQGSMYILLDSDNSPGVTTSGLVVRRNSTTVGAVGDVGENFFIVREDGRVGINTIAPAVELDVVGSASISSALNASTVTAAQDMYGAASSFRVIYHAAGDPDGTPNSGDEYPAHAHVVVNPTATWNLDEQFGLDVDDNLLVRGFIVGKHAIQLPGARMLVHFDGPLPGETNFGGNLTGHMGQIGRGSGGLIFRPGKFGKAAQFANAGTNLVTNPSFELDTAGWYLADGTTAGGVTMERSAEASCYGSYSLKVVNANAAQNDYARIAVGPLTASTTYTVSVWLNGEGITAAAYQNRCLYAYDTLNQSGTVESTYLTEATSGWVRHSVRVTTTADAGDHTIYILLYIPQGTTYYDAVQLEQTSTATPYMDGSLGGYDSAGTFMQEHGINRISNPSFETDTTGWTLNDGGTAGGVTMARSTEQACYGSASLKVTNTNAGQDDYAYFSAGNLAASTAYTISAWVYAAGLTSPATGSRGIYAFDIDSGGTAQASTLSVAAGGWARHSVTVTTTATAGAHTIRVRLYIPKGTVYWDAVQLEEGSAATPYMQGAGHSWSGAAHASTSSRVGAMLSYKDTTIISPAKGTIACWVYSTCTGTQTILRKGGATVNSVATHLILRLESGRFRSYWGNTGPIADVADAIAPNTWAHVAVSYDGTTISNYVNGRLVKTAVPTTRYVDVPANLLYVGRFTTADAPDGMIDDLVILDRCATADEIRAVYESNAPVFAETSTWQWRTAKNRFWADSEGIWMVNASGSPMFGAYAGSETDPTATRTWGGVALSAGDVIIGNQARGGYMQWDDDQSTMKFVGDGSSLTSINGGNIQTGTVAGDKISLTSYLAINDAVFGNKGIQIEYNAGNPRFYVGDGANVFLKFVGGATSTLSWKTSTTELTETGTLYASDVDLTGTITADTGNIGGWTIEPTMITSGTLNGTDYIKIIGGISGTARIEVGGYTTDAVAGICSRSSTSSGVVFWAGKSTANMATAPFRVQLDGKIFATQADITGAVKATSGYIGGSTSGWAIATNEINSTNIKLVSGADARLEVGSSANVAGITSNGTVFIWAGDTYANRANAEFSVTSAGKVKMTDAEFGSSSNVVIDSSGMYITADTGFNLVDKGYKFKQGTVFSAGMTAAYTATGGQTQLAIFNNKALDDTAEHNLNSYMLLTSYAVSGKESKISLGAYNENGGSTAYIDIRNINGQRVIQMYGDAPSGLSYNANVVWHAGNLTPANYALLSGASFTGDVVVDASHDLLAWGDFGVAGITYIGNYMRWATMSVPAYQNGYLILYVKDGGSGAIELRALISSPDGLRRADKLIVSN